HRAFRTPRALRQRLQFAELARVPRHQQTRLRLRQHAQHHRLGALRFHHFGREESVGYGGTTAPPEITIFSPSATLISRSAILSRGTSNKNPLVGFGVVGTNTFTTFSFVFSCASLPVSLVTKPSE